MALPNTFAPNTKILSALVNANFVYVDNATIALTAVVAGKLTAASNLSDLTNATTARTNLGLGTAATAAIGTSGATLGLLNANKTDSGNNIFSGTNAVSGALTVPTLALGTNTTGAASTAFVSAAIGAYTIRSYLAGLTLSTAGTSITYGVAVGIAANTTNVSMMALASAYTKTTSAWALGTAAGSLDTGAIATNTWYHVYLIQRPDTGIVDIAISTSATAPTFGSNIPAAYTLFRRIGSMKTNGSSQWIQFFQNGDEFLWSTPANDYTSQGVGTSAIVLTLSTPLGVRAEAIFNFAYNNTAGTNSYVNFGSVDQVSPANSALIGYAGPFNSSTLGGQWLGSTRIQTNLLSQIYCINTVASGAVWIYTQGYIDTRGRSA